MHQCDHEPDPLNIEDLKKDKVFWICWAVMLFVFFVLLFGAVESHAQVLAPGEMKEAVSILYAESASDPQGWSPKLNTYHKARRHGETLLKSMKRVSSAYQTKSLQYRKARSMRLNAHERRVYRRIESLVAQFRPAPHWPYIHHENLHSYPTKQLALAHLRKAWGPKVDYVSYRRIGKEYYFRIG